MKAALQQPIKQQQTSRSAGKMLAASLASAVTGIILVFAIPRLLSVDDFGYWRTFILYTGYTGILHLGLVDGALLNWSRPSHQQQGATFPRSFLALALQHLAILAAGLILLATPLARHPHFRSITLAVQAYALLFNLVGLVQVHLQSRHRFSAVALGTAAPGILFVCCVAALAAALHSRELHIQGLHVHGLHVQGLHVQGFHVQGFHVQGLTLTRLLPAYLLAWTLTLALLLAFAGQRRMQAEDVSAPRLSQPSQTSSWTAGLRQIRAHIRAGWPIMLANTSYGLMQSADRITVNLTRPIHDFAVYSLSQSTIYVPVTIIAAVSRVAFSHFAALHFAEAGEAARRQPYRAAVRILTLLWVLLLPYYFLVEWVVARNLPRYTSGLPAGKVLLLSVLFLSLIAIVQANAASLRGEQRRFFLGSLAALALAFLTAAIASRYSLTAVAWSQVFTAALWWIANETGIKKQTLLPTRETARVLTAFAAAAAGLYLASLWNAPAPMKGVLYYGLEAVPIVLLFRQELADSVTALRSTFHLRVANG